MRYRNWQFYKLFIGKTETNGGYIRGPDREDVIRWVGISWKGITVENMNKSFQKPKLLDYHHIIQHNVDMLDISMAETIDESFNLLDFDDPYLDDVEQEYLNHSELMLEGENID